MNDTFTEPTAEQIDTVARAAGVSHEAASVFCNGVRDEDGELVFRLAWNFGGPPTEPKGVAFAKANCVGLDPFGGSGSLGSGLHEIGVERDAPILLTDRPDEWLAAETALKAAGGIRKARLVFKPTSPDINRDKQFHLSGYANSLSVPIFVMADPRSPIVDWLCCRYTGPGKVLICDAKFREQSNGRPIIAWLGKGKQLEDIAKKCGPIKLSPEQADFRIEHAVKGSLTVGKSASPKLMAKILDQLGMKVLSKMHDRPRGYRVFSRERDEVVTIPDSRDLDVEAIASLFGNEAWQHVKQDPKGEEPYSIAEVRRAMSNATDVVYRPESVRGSGVWRVGPGRFALVDSQGVNIVEAGEIKPSESLELETPSGVLCFEPGGSKWFDLDTLQDDLARLAENPSLRSTFFNRLVELFGLWENLRDYEASRGLLAGMTVSALVSDAYKYRPIVLITGDSQSGKSHLTGEAEGVLPKLFGPSALTTTEATAASARQFIGLDCRQFIYDEFEGPLPGIPDPRKPLLRMLRGATDGSTALRGTVDQHGVSFRLCSPVILSAIEAGRLDPADANRMLRFRLDRFDPATHRPMLDRLETAEVIERIGKAALALALTIGEDARRLASHASKGRFKGLGPREAQNVAYAAAPAILCGATAPRESLEAKYGAAAVSKMPELSDTRDEAQTLDAGLIRRAVDEMAVYALPYSAGDEVEASAHERFVQSLRYAKVRLPNNSEIAFERLLGMALGRGGFSGSESDRLELRERAWELGALTFRATDRKEASVLFSVEKMEAPGGLLRLAGLHDRDAASLLEAGDRVPLTAGQKWNIRKEKGERIKGVELRLTGPLAFLAAPADPSSPSSTRLSDADGDNLLE